MAATDSYVLRQPTSKAVSLVANLIVILGCISPGAKDFALYRINVARLAGGLVKQTKNGPRDAAELLDPNLPTWWYLGMSGICDVDEVEGVIRCHREFPSTKALLTVVEDSLRRDSQVSLPENGSRVLSAWTTTLGNLPPYLLANEQSFVLQGKVSVYLVIVAIAIDFFSPFLALISKSSRIRPYTPPAISGLITFVAGTLATLSMNNGPGGVVNTGEYVGVGIIILFVGATVRLASSAIGIRLIESRRPEHQTGCEMRSLGNKEIGYLGEAFVPFPPSTCMYIFTNTLPQVNARLEQNIPRWSCKNWTSSLRNRRATVCRQHPGIGPPPFLRCPPFWGNDRDYADFTYPSSDHEHSGAMIDFLRREGVDTTRVAAN